MVAIPDNEHTRKLWQKINAEHAAIDNYIKSFVHDYVPNHPSSPFPTSEQSTVSQKPKSSSVGSTKVPDYKSIRPGLNVGNYLMKGCAGAMLAGVLSLAALMASQLGWFGGSDQKSLEAELHASEKQPISAPLEPKYTASQLEDDLRGHTMLGYSSQANQVFGNIESRVFGSEESSRDRQYRTAIHLMDKIAQSENKEYHTVLREHVSDFLERTTRHDYNKRAYDILTELFLEDGEIQEKPLVQFIELNSLMLLLHKARSQAGSGRGPEEWRYVQDAGEINMLFNEAYQSNPDNFSAYQGPPLDLPFGIGGMLIDRPLHVSEAREYLELKGEWESQAAAKQREIDTISQIETYIAENLLE